MFLNKKKLQCYLAKNSYLNEIVYAHWKSHKTKAASQFYNSLAGDDSIKDITNLRKVRSAFDSQDHFQIRDINLANSLNYGIKNAIFPFNSKSRPSIEHGLILFDNIFEDIRLTSPMVCATMGPFRKEVIQSFRKLPVFTVGPYIQYADSFYDLKYIENLKKQNGRTLLVFPSHSTDGTNITYEEEQYFNHIRDIASHFCKVIVCSYWWNLNDALIKRFETEGYQIVSAGIRDDVSFISRLRSIILLGDVAVGDGIGTHVGYCFNLGVPYYLIDTYSYHTTSTKGLNYRSDREEEIKNALYSKDEHNIDYVLKKYWGNNVCLTIEERKAVCDISADLKKTTLGFYSKTERKIPYLIAKYREEGRFLHAKLLSEASL